MTKDVLVSITGLQFELEGKEADSVEVICAGEYYFRNGKHYIIYEELMEEEGIDAVTKCTLKISKKQVDLVKKGASNVHMVFEMGENHMTYYNTPFGAFMLGVATNSIDYKETKDALQVELSYGLSMEYQFLMECNLKISVTSKEV